MERRFFVCGNWKCNGSTDEVKQVIGFLKDAQVPPNADVAISPPLVYLPLVKSLLRADFQIAAQNCWMQAGDFTGEVSVEMLVDLGLHWVVLGHSERRTLFGESDEIVGKKIGSALSKGLNIIACVGENAEQHKDGLTRRILGEQLKAIGDQISSWNNIIITYEPVWTFGTGEVATSKIINDTHLLIREWLRENASEQVAQSTRIIYGGFVDRENCREFAALPEVDGFLVGSSSSLKAEFVDIIKSAAASRSSSSFSAQENM